MIYMKSTNISPDHGRNPTKYGRARQRLETDLFLEKINSATVSCKSYHN